MKSNAIPATVRTAVAASVGCMVAALGIPQDRVDAALRALFAELEGATASSITDTEPFDRAISRRQAATILNCSAITISRHVRDGRLRGIFAGRSRQRLTGICAESLRELLGQRNVKEGRA